MQASAIVVTNNMIELNAAEIAEISGALRVNWDNKATNWGEVLAWTAGGAIAGARGGAWGMGLGALGGGAADYVGQHLQIYW
jgi:uncharacterized membrane protein